MGRKARERGNGKDVRKRDGKWDQTKFVDRSTPLLDVTGSTSSGQISSVRAL